MELGSSDFTIKKLLFRYLKKYTIILFTISKPYQATYGGGGGFLKDVIGRIKVAIFWLFSGLFLCANLFPKGTLITLVPMTEWTSELFAKRKFLKSGKFNLWFGKALTLPDLESLFIASNTPNKFDAW